MIYIVYHYSLSTITIQTPIFNTSIINICCCVSSEDAAQLPTRDTCCCHASNTCFYKTINQMNIQSSVPLPKFIVVSYHLLLYHTFIHRTERHEPRGIWQTREIFHVGWLLLHQPFCRSYYGYHGRRVVVYKSNISIHMSWEMNQRYIWVYQSTFRWLSASTDYDTHIG